MEDGNLRTENSSFEYPSNIEAEQALLGTLLLNNDSFDRIREVISEDHFFDPVHSKIFELISSKIQKNSLASPVSLKPFFDNDKSLDDLGGASYLVKLASSAISLSGAEDYAKIIFDMAIRRHLILLGGEMIDKATNINLEDDGNQQIADAEKSLYDLAEIGKNKGRTFSLFVKAAAKAVETANFAYKKGGGTSGLPTQFIDLDKKLGGLHPSDLIILAGRPSMGKTSLATNIAFNAAKEMMKKPDSKSTVGFFSLEMSSEQLATRILSESCEIASEQIRKGDLKEDEFKRFVESAQQLESMPLFIDDTPALSIAELASRARRLKRTDGLDLLIIDYLQLVRGSSFRDNRVNEISEITQGLKAIAKDLNIPVLALSQLSRQVENRDDKKPQLADLRESGSIEQDADVVLFIFREEYYKEREKPGDHDLEAITKWQSEMSELHGKAEVIIGKQRHGPIGTIELSFEGKYTRFGNLAKNY